ncbi:MBOAT family protein [Phormidium sp. LEGE 05292]|uniref:MBOAT family O-acyltransferase n=1 Tax=[Phormidium] sp. LEGE 05292 TaxID=767427 RepID=UPI00188262A2|nr:MBOAT family protein [Phormidium sp. LEGE 05292]MBE9225979.1 MBOAT family protein [Phormidium sp. LEGE 05292]
MLFNSYSFIFGFLPITLIVFFTLTKFRLISIARTWLLIASLVFYANWNVSYLPLLLISISCNYLIGKYIEQAQPNIEKAKLFLWLGICFNLALLGYYKYANFFIKNLSELIHTNWQITGIILPLGISFYTFIQIAYLVDTYNGKAKQSDFLTHSLFVAFFPHVIAGPISDNKQVIPQFQKLKTYVFSHKNMARGLALFILGLAKKVLIGDHIASWVAPVFDNAFQVSFIEAWVGALSYTLQLYFDFSGYSDMAVGLGLMLNIKLPINFNSPYKAFSISDFWRRWHITLSNFLRDYLYIPLGGSRQGEIRRYANLIITMLLGGLWHGAGWTFVIWGALHGIYLSINHSWKLHGKTLPKSVGWTITFLAVVVSWVFFRARNATDAWQILQTMIGAKGVVIASNYESLFGWLSPIGVKFSQSFPYLKGGGESLIVLAALLVGVTVLPNTNQMLQLFKPNLLWVISLTTLAALCLLSLNRVSEFLYFQF